MKCYKHNTNYFLAFYLMNENKNLFFSTSQDNYKELSNSFTSQLFDFKLENGETVKYDVD